MKIPAGDDRDQAVQDFATEYGCTLPTAECMVYLFITVATAKDKGRAQEEFDHAVRTGVEVGAVWALDFTEGYMRTHLTQAPVIYAEATARGGDPTAALRAVYTLTDDAVTGLVAVLKSRAA
jgi:hypothetical protein